jgi:signal transduction histidine kinase
VTIRVDVDGRMRGDADKLRRVILNLLANALDALEEAEVPQPHIEIEAGENLAGNEVWVRVRDNGPGMDAERLQRIFSPFYTSKETGTGLGLAVSKKVVDAHGGSIEAHSEPGAGTSFLLTLPKQREARA